MNLLLNSNSLQIDGGQSTYIILLFVQFWMCSVEIPVRYSTGDTEQAIRNMSPNSEKRLRVGDSISASLEHGWH
jgi:hypothetical protein